MALPKFVALKSVYNNKYLRYIHEDVKVHGFLQFSGEEVVSPYTKFEVEIAKSGNGLVHLRCCYNNKYLVRESESSYWILGKADEQEEDQSLWSCTLFKPIYVDGDANTVQFLHVQLGHYACLWRAAAPFHSCLFAGSKNPDRDLCDVYTIIDWETLFIVPKYVAFKGINGKYLNSLLIGGQQYLQFSATDIADPKVGTEVFTTHDGSIHIKSDYFGKFWRRASQDWILADTDDTTSNDPDTFFWPIKVDNNVIALRKLGNNYFCKRYTTASIKECLNARDSTISDEARIEVAELVISRDISNVDFHLLDARIYNQRIQTLATGVAINTTSEPNEAEVKLPYKMTKSITWNSNVSLKLMAKTSLQSGIPLIEEGKVKITSDFSGAYEWGESIETTISVVDMHKVTVPAMTKITVSLLATTGSCDVPFSYFQLDTHTDGRRITNIMDDGIYTGINSYNLKYETKEEKL